MTEKQATSDAKRQAPETADAVRRPKRRSSGWRRHIRRQKAQKARL